MPFEDIPLSDGRKIPAIAFGTGSIYKWTDVTHYVQQALEAGFSHIDTAQAYETEAYVGNAIQQSALARSDFYITTKYSRPNLSVDESIRNSLSQLGLKFVDLYLIHQPSLSKDIVGTWVELEDVKKAGLAKSIGVSNFPVSSLEKIEADPRVHSLPTVNQIQLHPYNYAQQQPTVDWCQARGIVVEAYGGLSSLTKYPGGPVDPPVAAAARKLGISPTQVLMGWLRAKGVVIVTTTSNKGRLEEYLASGDLPPLPPSYVAAIDEAGAKGPPGAVRVAFERLSTYVVPNELAEGLRKVAKDRKEEEERDPELRQRRETMRKHARVAFVPLVLFLVGYLVYMWVLGPGWVF
ncbi:Aldo-ket-red domain-containing protein [Mycena chlorophos]|uniref:Aldo-ket-red domain-containing protein n=1 Tax=Mycena chlorophos TaxID=658473 RepID=A0A8H6VQY3_MYCCL|nr:Aldo-ket-red domain-containing protein [Mycena chlorophos]